MNTLLFICTINKMYKENCGDIAGLASDDLTSESDDGDPFLHILLDPRVLIPLKVKVDIFSSAVFQGVDPNQADSNSITALHLIISKHHIIEFSNVIFNLILPHKSFNAGFTTNKHLSYISALLHDINSDNDIQEELAHKIINHKSLKTGDILSMVHDIILMPCRFRFKQFLMREIIASAKLDQVQSHPKINKTMELLLNDHSRISIETLKLIISHKSFKSHNLLFDFVISLCRNKPNYWLFRLELICGSSALKLERIGLPLLKVLQEGYTDPTQYPKKKHPKELNSLLNIYDVSKVFEFAIKNVHHINCLPLLEHLYESNRGEIDKKVRDKYLVTLKRHMQSTPRLEQLDAILSPSGYAVKIYDYPGFHEQPKHLVDHQLNNYKQIISIKNYAHLFGLDSSIYVTYRYVELAANKSLTSLAYVYKLFSEFCFHDKRYNSTAKSIRKLLSTSFNFKYLFSNTNSCDLIEQMAKHSAQLARKTGVLILTGWYGHTFSIYIHKEKLYRCNGGVGREFNTIECFRISRLEHLPNVIETLYTRNSSVENMEFIQNTMLSLLKCKKIFNIDITPQHSDNCTMHNVFLGIEAYIFDKNKKDKSRKKEIFNYKQIVNIIRYRVIHEIKGKMISCQFHAAIFGAFLAEAYRTTENTELALQVASESKSITGAAAATYLVYSWLIEKDAVACTATELERHHVIRKAIPLNNPGHVCLDSITYSFVHRVLFYPQSIRTTDILQVIDLFPNIHNFNIIHMLAIHDDIKLSTQFIEEMLPAQVTAQINTPDFQYYLPLAYVKSIAMSELLISKGALVTKEIVSSVVMVPFDHIVRWAPCYYVRNIIARFDPKPTFFTISQSLFNGDDDVFELLLDTYPFLVKAQGGNGESIVQIISESNSISKLNIAARKGAYFFKADVNGVTPIMAATRAGNWDIVEVLKAHHFTFVLNSDSYYLRKRKQTPTNSEQPHDVHLEELKGQNDVTRQAQSVYRKFYKDNYNGIFTSSSKIIYDAVEHSNYMAVYGCLLTFPHVCIDKPLPGKDLATIHNAILKGNIRIIGLILQAPDLRINTLDTHERTPLHYAAQATDVEILHKVLRSRNVDVNAKDKSGKTPLMVAAMTGNSVTTEILVELEQVYKNDVDENSNSALDLSITEQIYRLLSKKGVVCGSKAMYRLAVI